MTKRKGITVAALIKLACMVEGFMPHPVIKTTIMITSMNNKSILLLLLNFFISSLPFKFVLYLLYTLYSVIFLGFPDSDFVYNIFPFRECYLSLVLFQAPQIYSL